MYLDKIITILSYVLTIGAFVWGLYNKVKGDSIEAVSALIAAAETSGLSNPEKMESVVSQLYEMIPGAFKKILNKAVLQKIAQFIFDYTKKYALAYIEEKQSGSTEAYHEVNAELAADVIDKLSQLSSVKLKALAVSLDVDIQGKDDKQIIKDIVLVLIDKS